MKQLIFTSLLFIAACGTKQVPTTPSDASTTLAHDRATVLNGKLFAGIFHQQAAEYRALCFQAFNIARLRLDTYKATSRKPRAIITDIDETLLDNSPYEAQQGLKGKEYEPESWNQWTAKGIADTMPGSASFLKYAASRGVTIFYITNRDEKERAGTLKNLRLYNFPNADSAHLLPRQGISSKEARRKMVAANYEIILLLGDNLVDFSVLFDKRTSAERLRNTNFSASDFGNRFIILPNSIYGDWESALYNYNKYTLAQKDSILRSVLKRD